MDFRTATTALLLLPVTIYAALLLLESFLSPKSEPNEPPVVSQRIPYLEHVLRLFLNGTHYFDITSARAKSPIYALNVLSSKLYVVTGPDLVNAVSRNAKTLSFTPFITGIAIRLTGVDDATAAVIKENAEGKRGPWGYAIEVHDQLIAALALGPNLDKLNQAMLEQSAVYLRGVRSELQQHPVLLQAWIRHFVTICSTTALYGAENPFIAQPRLEDAFRDFDADMDLLMINIAPALLARKGHRGRSQIAAAFRQYYARPPAGRSSALVEARYETAVRNGMSVAGISQSEIGTLIGALINVIPTTFYMLHYVCSDETLLRDVRAELETCIRASGEEEGKRLRLDTAKLKDACPLLLSTFHEVLRVHSRGASARLVLEDTLLDERYLLRKDAVVLMPTSVIHNDAAAWGPTTGFDARRFLKAGGGEGAKRSSSGGFAASYRPFGGGTTLCPGRHFAAAEVLALTAMLVFQYEVRPASGEWRLPAAVQPNLAVNVFPPKEDVLVWMRAREGLGGAEWGFGSG